MNYSAIFRTAHAHAKIFRSSFPSYRAAFGFTLSRTLKKAWAKKKEQQAKAAAKAQQSQTIDLGNGESLSRGIVEQTDGSFTVLTFSRSWTYKTLKGAQKKWAQVNADKQVSMFG